MDLTARANACCARSGCPCIGGSSTHMYSAACSTPATDAKKEKCKGCMAQVTPKISWGCRALQLTETSEQALSFVLVCVLKKLMCIFQKALPKSYFLSAPLQRWQDALHEVTQPLHCPLLLLEFGLWRTCPISFAFNTPKYKKLQSRSPVSGTSAAGGDQTLWIMRCGGSSELLDLNPPEDVWWCWWDDGDRYLVVVNSSCCFPAFILLDQIIDHGQKIPVLILVAS